MRRFGIINWDYGIKELTAMEKMVLLDGYSLMYRAYHALHTPMSAPDGTPTNAVHGFVMMLLKVIGE